jgi:hypothetical protein
MLPRSGQSLSQADVLAQTPTECTRGTKYNAQGYKVSWNGYKLHLDTADCGVPVSAILSSLANTFTPRKQYRDA